MLVTLLVCVLMAISLLIDAGILVGSLVVGSVDLKTLATLVLLRYLLVGVMTVHLATTHINDLLRFIDALPRRLRRPLLLGEPLSSYSASVSASASTLLPLFNMTIAQEDHCFATEQFLLCPVPDCLYDQQPPLTSTALLEDHLQEAHGGGVHLCLASSICFNHLPLFANHQQLSNHIATTHTEAVQESDFRCFHCSSIEPKDRFRFPTINHLQRHFYFEHEEGVFTCVDPRCQNRGFTAQLWAGVVQHWPRHTAEYLAEIADHTTHKNTHNHDTIYLLLIRF
ncbi:hypothetical protein TYRP_015938 [Tyrophagus putrescentiae]|nr:hypothetical protein TYRP_015938 [Tyrophagus putrescentiae]